ncbi:MAG: hypothetical protein ACTSPD_05245 [Promethearchaeota archaeon]
MIGYYCHNQDKKLPDKKNLFYLNLNLIEYNWSSLFNEMETRFNKDLEKKMGEEELNDLIEKNYENYIQLRDAFFKKNKKKIINDWFILNEDKIQEYLERTLQDLKEAFFIKKKIIF